jgi:hypothetical protein
MFRSLPSRIQLSEREVYQTLQQVIVERAVRQQLENLRMDDITSDDLRYCHLRATSPWSPPSSPSTPTSSSSSSSGIICTPSDTEAVDMFDGNVCLLAASSPSPSSREEEDSSPPPSFLSDEHATTTYRQIIPARLARARLAVNRRGRQESTGSLLENEEDEIGGDDSLPLEQGALAQTLPSPRYRIRRVVGSGHHGAFL